MKIQDVNNLSSEEFIENFNNIFEKTSSVAISSEKKRPFNDKNEMIETFINEFDNLNIDSKKNVLINHPDLGNKLKITNDLTEMSKDEQRNVGLDNCTEDEFLYFKKMNDEYKLKFSILGWPIKYIIRTRAPNNHQSTHKLNTCLLGRLI